MKCSKCGKTYDDQLNFCPFCGEKSHVVQDNIEMDNNYGGTLNRILNIICSKTVLSAICVIAGGLLALSYKNVSSFQSYLETEGISEPFKVLQAASNSMGSIPRYFSWAKTLSIYVFIVSLVNAIRKKEPDYALLSSLSVLNAFILIINTKTVSILKQIMNLDLSSAYSSFYYFSSNESAYRLLKNPDRLIEGVQGEAGFGIFFLIISLLLFIFYLIQFYKHKKFDFNNFGFIQNTVANKYESLNSNYLKSIQKTVSYTYENIKSEHAKLNATSSCKKCGRVLQANMKFCPSCGAPVIIEKQKNHCKKCGKEFDKDMNFCPYCGEKASSSLIDTKAMQEELLRRSGKKLCKSCGKAFKIEMNFCPFCGTQYKTQSESHSLSFSSDHPFFKNYYIQLFSQENFLAKFGIVVGALLSFTLILVYGVASTMNGDSFSSGMDSIQAVINTFKILPLVYYVALIICIFICIFSILHLVREKSKKVFGLALISGINAFLLLGCSNTIKMIRGIYSLDLSDVMNGEISSSLISNVGSFIQNPEQAMNDLVLAFAFGFIILGYSIYLLVYLVLIVLVEEKALLLLL